MAGSPRYLTLLAQAADRAQLLTDEMVEEEPLDTLWAKYDGSWKRLVDHQLPINLMDFSIQSLILLSRITGESIESLAQQGAALHIAKNAGYAGATNPDPWANFRMATMFGSTAVAGALIRLGDKYIRTVNLRANPNNDQVNEPIAETLRDAVAYPLITICLDEEGYDVPA